MRLQTIFFAGSLCFSLACGSLVQGTASDAGPESGSVTDPPPPPLVPANKVDLLFMIDNSASMGDKQAVLADAVPKLLVGLLQPKCVGPKGGGPLPARSRRFPHVFRVACPKLAMKRLEAIGEESGPKQHHGLSAVL